MSNDLCVLSEKEEKELEVKVTTAIVKVSDVSKEMKSAKEKGKAAKGKAESVKTGFLNSNTKAIQELRDAAIITADTTLDTLDVVDKVSANQIKMAEACSALVCLGATSIAHNRAAIKFIRKTMAEGAAESLDEETKNQLVGVIRDLKDKGDFLFKLKEQGDRINEHEKLFADTEVFTKEMNLEINESRKMLIRHDNAIDELCSECDERDKRINECFGSNKKQDERLEQVEINNINQDSILEELQNKDKEYDRVQDDFESRIKQLENDILSIKNSKRTQLFFSISVALGVAGVILGLLALFKY